MHQAMQRSLYSESVKHADPGEKLYLTMNTSVNVHHLVLLMDFVSLMTAELSRAYRR